MHLESPMFSPNGIIPPKYTCDGENRNPPLRIEGIPESAQSIAVIAEDPDAPKGTYTHWTIWNVSPKEADFPDGQIPLGAIEGQTSFGKKGYGGPCPPVGQHRYVFRAFALKEPLDLRSGATLDDFHAALEGKVLASAELVGVYERLQA